MTPATQPDNTVLGLELEGECLERYREIANGRHGRPMSSSIARDCRANVFNASNSDRRWATFSGRFAVDAGER